MNLLAWVGYVQDSESRGFDKQAKSSIDAIADVRADIDFLKTDDVRS